MQGPSRDRGPATAVAPRLAAFYAAVFGTVGIALPFWPVWLSSRGLDPGAIGAVLTVGFWVRVGAAPLAARIADRTGNRRAVLVALGALGFSAYLAFAFVHGLAAYLVLAAVAGAAVAPLAPLGDSITMRHATVDRIDYGRVRLWGSLAFIAASVGVGRLLGAGGPDVVLWCIVCTMAATLLASIALPRPARRTASRASRGDLSRLLDRRFVLFIVAAALVQSSHVVYYAFASIHWRAAGIDSTVIGLLWAEGVVAEVLLFAFGGRLTGRLHPRALLVVAGAAGVVRWTALATTTAPAALVAVQALHALTFGAAHLGAMRYLTRAVPEGLSSTAQSFYSAAVSGVAFGVTTPVAALLYARVGGGAYFFGAALAAAGALLAAGHLVFAHARPNAV